MSVADKKLAGYLAEFRKQEKKSQVATIADNRDVVAVLAVWPACARAWRPVGKAPREPFARWRWLWRCVWLDLEELAGHSQQGLLEAESNLRVCYALRIAYPDGTISKHAKQLIESHGRARDPSKVTTGRPKGSKDKAPRKSRKSDE